MSGLTITSIDDPPMSLDFAKGHLKVLHSDDDGNITALIAAGFEYVERYTGRLFRRATVEFSLPEFPDGEITLPRSPLRSVTSVDYIDTDGAAQSLDGGILANTAAIPATIDTDIVWPSTKRHPQAVTVTYEAGQVTCPAIVTQAVLIFLDREYHDHSTAKMARLEQRIRDLVGGLKIRNRRLAGVGD